MDDEFRNETVSHLLKVSFGFYLCAITVFIGMAVIVTIDPKGNILAGAICWLIAFALMKGGDRFRLQAERLHKEREDQN